MPSVFEPSADEKVFVAQVCLAIEKAENAEGAAKGVYEVCLEYCRRHGMPENEAALYQPGQDRYIRDTADWQVSFEGGPYRWATTASLKHGNMRILAEPYFNWDLCFEDLDGYPKKR